MLKTYYLTITIITNFKNDKKEGSYKKWYKNGQLNIEGNYENNSPIGNWPIYDEYGRVDDIILY